MVFARGRGARHPSTPIASPLDRVHTQEYFSNFAPVVDTVGEFLQFGQLAIELLHAGQTTRNRRCVGRMKLATLVGVLTRSDVLPVNS